MKNLSPFCVSYEIPVRVLYISRPDPVAWVRVTGAMCNTRRRKPCLPAPASKTRTTKKAQAATACAFFVVQLNRCVLEAMGHGYAVDHLVFA
jgi:hypothetical protein